MACNWLFFLTTFRLLGKSPTWICLFDAWEKFQKYYPKNGDATPMVQSVTNHHQKQIQDHPSFSSCLNQTTWNICFLNFSRNQTLSVSIISPIWIFHHWTGGCSAVVFSSRSQVFPCAQCCPLTLPLGPKKKHRNRRCFSKHRLRTSCVSGWAEGRRFWSWRQRQNFPPKGMCFLLFWKEIGNIWNPQNVDKQKFPQVPEENCCVRDDFFSRQKTEFPPESCNIVKPLVWWTKREKVQVFWHFSWKNRKSRVERPNSEGPFFSSYFSTRFFFGKLLRWKIHQDNPGQPKPWKSWKRQH